MTVRPGCRLPSRKNQNSAVGSAHHCLDKLLDKRSRKRECLIYSLGSKLLVLDINEKKTQKKTHTNPRPEQHSATMPIMPSSSHSWGILPSGATHMFLHSYGALPPYFQRLPFQFVKREKKQYERHTHADSSKIIIAEKMKEKRKQTVTDQDAYSGRRRN